MSSLTCLQPSDPCSPEQKQVSRVEKLLNGLGLTIALAILAAASQPSVRTANLPLQDLLSNPVKVVQNVFSGPIDSAR